MEKRDFDLIIIGTGPAGLSAAIYCSRYKMDFAVIGNEVGGRINETHLVENYPGIPSMQGFELGQKFAEHAKGLGTTIFQETVKEIKKEGEIFTIVTEKATYTAKNILYALGSEYRKLKIKGEDEFRGKGVSYCATCDGPFFRGKRVIVVGGGNSAAGAALMLSEYASEVLIFYRGDELKFFPVYMDQIKANPKIKISCCTNLKEIKGEGVVKSVLLDVSFEGNQEVLVDGVFIEIGSEPSVEMLIPLGVELDPRHFIVTKQDQSTNVEGLFAAGDITTNSNGFRQIVTAASEGAIAALAIYEKVKRDKK